MTVIIYLLEIRIWKEIWILGSATLTLFARTVLCRLRYFGLWQTKIEVFKLSFWKFNGLIRLIHSGVIDILYGPQIKKILVTNDIDGSSVKLVLLIILS